jgi:glycosyltransferase involved in cell wall biosynthesis
MKVLFLNYTDEGGAGLACLKIVDSLKKKIKCDYKVRIKIKKNKYYETIDHNNSIKIDNYKKIFNRIFSKLANKNIKSFQSPDLFSSNFNKFINASDYDLVHLVWINGFLSIEDIGKINKPIVWTFADMWPFTGINHYDADNNKAFWKKRNFLTFKKNNLFNFDRYLLEKKILHWNNLDLNIVTPSKWLKDCCNKSQIFYKKKIDIIPWPINLKIFKKRNKTESRKKLKLSLRKKLIVFGCINGINDHRKGWDLLSKSISINKDNFEIIIFGTKKPKNFQSNFKQKIRWLGKINSSKKISELFSASDVLALPSRYDNLPQVAMEAQACGLPILSFAIGGVKEMINHKKNGYIAKKFCIEDFSTGLSWLIKNNSSKMIKANINHAKKKYESNKIANDYIKLYKKIIKK